MSGMLFAKSKPIRLPWLLSPRIRDSLPKLLIKLAPSGLVNHLPFSPKKPKTLLRSKHINSELVKPPNLLKHNKHHNSHPNQNNKPQSQPLLQNPTHLTECSSNLLNKFRLPAVSPTMTEGKIIEWKVKVGDSFEATMDYEATEKGVLAKIINEGTSALPVGEPVAVFTKKKEDVDKFKDFTLGSASSQSQPASKAP